jgi:hypothetical protein
LQITSLVRLPGSIRHDSPPAEPKFSFAWPGFVRARRGSARPSMLTPRPSGGASGEVRQGQHGLQRSLARRLMAVVSAHCRYFGVRAAIFRAVKRSAAKWRGRKMAALTEFRPDSARPFPACLGSLWPSERAKASCGVGVAECGSEWSGRKAGESGRARAKPCRWLRGASVGSVRPGNVPNTNFPPFAGRGSAPLLCRIALAMSFSAAAPARPKTIEFRGRVDWNNCIRAL